MNKPIYVTKPSLAPLEEFIPYLEQIWESGVMTHNGPLMQQLERELATFLDVPDAICLSNGTSALQLAIRAMDLQGDIITTPFSFVATACIIDWERCTPVFVDIDPDTWNIDPDKIEEAITENTVAIMPVHVFSAPCDVLAIQEIADKHGLKVIYDAAHAMGVNVHGQSIMSYGDVSCTSFHATKLFNTCEGGACFTHNPELAARIRRMRFFGFDENKEITDAGMNAKMTEIAAALGLANLPHIGAVLEARKSATEYYKQCLAPCKTLQFQKYDEGSYNFSYMPVLFPSEEGLLQATEALSKEQIFPRRYFYPSLDTVEFYQRKAPLLVSGEIARRILCFPLYFDLEMDAVERICQIVIGSQCS